MLLSKITINNFRLIVNAELDVHRNITLIVGRNNTAKTSCMSILEKVVKNKVLSYNDYPLQRRKYAFILLAQFMRKKITYGLCGRSLEEAIKNVNRAFYGLADPVTEKKLEFTEKSKTDFALRLICDYPDYSIPKYLKDGLVWLNKQKILV